MFGGGSGTLSSLFECNIGEPWELFGSYNNYAIGGWYQFGYHNNALPLFNSRPSEFQLQQAWGWAEKSLDTSCGFDFGGRIDYVYGTDAPDTQAFGISNDHWDNDWDHGRDYGHALPQVYFEAGYQDISVKGGKFFTIIGYEVVPAPDNFFYSHAYTMYNSEPFTHTGILTTYAPMDEVTIYGGWVLGWDSGYERNGDAFLGGISLSLSDRISVTYATVAGRFADADIGSVFDNEVWLGENGYMHSIVADVAVTDKLQWIFQHDYLDTHDQLSNTVRNTVGILNYLIYNVNDCVGVGGRVEWYQQQGVFTDAGDKTDIAAFTMGLNYKPCANAIIRPEVRWDWDESRVVGLKSGDNQNTFGIDMILLL